MQGSVSFFLEERLSNKIKQYDLESAEKYTQRCSRWLSRGERSSLVLPGTAAANKSRDSRYARLSEVAGKKQQANNYYYDLIKLSNEALYKNMLQSSLYTCEQLFLLTLLKSLAVELSSSRQGMRWTNASIWYLAFINSDLFGLWGQHGSSDRNKEAVNESAAHAKLNKLTSSERKVLIHYFQTAMTHCSLSWGLALRFPLITDAGSRRECSHIEFEPLLYNVWTI